jgi:acetyltransferase-like isoleucine patch superfamily enzyme
MIFDRLGRRWRWWQLKTAGAQVAYDLQTAGPFFSGNARGFTCGPGACFSAGARVIVASCDKGPGELRIGERLFVNHYAIIDCNYRISIGNDVLIGPHTYIGDFDHDTRITDGSAIRRGFIGLPVEIGDHVWIGAGAIILKAVRVGPGAVIGAGSVVIRDVPAMAVVAGVPAKVLKFRDEMAEPTVCRSRDDKAQISSENREALKS